MFLNWNTAKCFKIFVFIFETKFACASTHTSAEKYSVNMRLNLSRKIGVRAILVNSLAIYGHICIQCLSKSIKSQNILKVSFERIRFLLWGVSGPTVCVVTQRLFLGGIVAWREVMKPRGSAWEWGCRI